MPRCPEAAGDRLKDAGHARRVVVAGDVAELAGPDAFGAAGDDAGDGAALVVAEDAEDPPRRRLLVDLSNEAAVLRLAGSILLEVHDEWQIAERRYLSEGSMAKLYEKDKDDDDKKEVGAKTKSCSPADEQLHRR